MMSEDKIYPVSETAAERSQLSKERLPYISLCTDRQAATYLA